MRPWIVIAAAPDSSLIRAISLTFCSLSDHLRTAAWFSYARRVFEVTPAGPVERFATMSYRANPYGDGDFIDEQDDGGVRYCVRGNLDGSFDRVPTPGGALICKNNTRGDVVAFVPSSPAAQSPGLWRLLRADTSFRLASDLKVEAANTGLGPSIEANATVSLAYVESGVVRLSRFGVGDLAGEHHELAPYGGRVYGDDFGSRVWYDADADGRGVLTFLVREPASLPGGAQCDVVQLARFEPGMGLRSLSVDVRRWPVVPFHPMERWLRSAQANVGESGSACVVLGAGYWNYSGFSSSTIEVLRVESDDRLTPVRSFASTLYNPKLAVPQVILRGSPFRAEQWAMSLGTSAVRLVRSRPDADVGPVTFAHASLGPQSTSWSFDFDDSGRAVAVLTETAGTQVTTRILVWN